MDFALGAYITSLKECTKGDCAWDPTAIVEDIEQLCLREAVTDDDIAAASATLLDKDDGIMAFVELARNSPSARIATKKARERVFDFVAKFITSVLNQRVVPYAFDIQAACLNSVWLEME
eukprot:4502419-Pyramimonas_sp.AAC.1